MIYRDTTQHLHPVENGKRTRFASAGALCANQYTTDASAGALCANQYTTELTSLHSHYDCACNASIKWVLYLSIFH